MEDTGHLQAQLQRRTRDLREDFSLLKTKVQQSQEQLSPTRFMRRHTLILCAVAVTLGAILGYQDVPNADVAKPAIRSTLSTAGRQAAVRAIRG